VFSVEAAEVLRREGFRVRRLEVGVPEWKRLDLPVVVDRGAA
jgi:hypothetical protein